MKTKQVLWQHKNTIQQNGPQPLAKKRQRKNKKRWCCMLVCYVATCSRMRGSSTVSLYHVAWWKCITQNNQATIWDQSERNECNHSTGWLTTWNSISDALWECLGQCCCRSLLHQKSTVSRVDLPYQLIQRDQCFLRLTSLKANKFTPFSV